MPKRVYDFVSGVYGSTQIMEIDLPEDRFVTREVPSYVHSIAEEIVLTEEQWEGIPVNLVTVVSAVNPVTATYNMPLNS